MNIKDAIEKEYTPELAIVVYASPGKSSFYLEKLDISSKDGRYVTGEASPLKKETLKNLSAVLNETEGQFEFGKGIIPKNLLHYNIKKSGIDMVWHTEAKKFHLLFAKNLDIPDGEYEMPTIVFHVRNKDLKVFAVKTVKASEKSQLFKAPFHNVYENVCMGNVKVPDVSKTSFKEAMMLWEKAFFGSVFTHFGHGSPIDGNLNSVLKEMHKKDKPFPLELLVPVNKNKKLTVEKYINQL